MSASLSSVASAQDIEEVEKLLGRRPQGEFKVAIRSDNGSPVVLENAPFLDDGRPMPTRFWLVDRRLVKEIGRIESTGGVKEAEAAVDADELRDCHRRHGEDRDARIPEGHDGPTPTGGVGGTRVGVKCLHAHYANYLVNGDDPVGRWVDEQLVARAKLRQTSKESGSEMALYLTASEAVRFDGPTLLLDLGVEQTAYYFGQGHSPMSRWVADVSGAALERDYLLSDPPTASELSAALSIVELHVTDALRELPGLGLNRDSLSVAATGSAFLIAAVELGVGESELETPSVLRRADAEDLFRTLAVEPKHELLHNPGLPAERAFDIVGSTCVLLETLRQLGVETLTVLSSVSLRAVR